MDWKSVQKARIANVDLVIVLVLMYTLPGNLNRPASICEGAHGLLCVTINISCNRTADLASLPKAHQVAAEPDAPVRPSWTAMGSLWV